MWGRVQESETSSWFQAHESVEGASLLLPSWFQSCGRTATLAHALCVSAQPRLDQHTTPVDQHTTPVDQQTTMADQHTTPMDQHTTPADQHTILVGSTHNFGGSTHNSGGSTHTTPAGSTHNPGGSTHDYFGRRQMREAMRDWFDRLLLLRRTIPEVSTLRSYVLRSRSSRSR